MTLKRTIADLVDDVGELSLVGNALRDASRTRELGLTRLRDLLAPLASRHGFDKGDGAALLGRLMQIAGIDPDASPVRSRPIRPWVPASPRITAGTSARQSANGSWPPSRRRRLRVTDARD